MSPRPKNIRKVNDMPVAAGFKPIGLNGCCKNTIFLHFEEYEAIRLCDYEMKTQQEASVSMGVSRPTLSRIYVSARQKIAKALVRGVTIMIEGGEQLNTQSRSRFNKMLSELNENFSLNERSPLMEELDCKIRDRISLELGNL